MTGAPTWYDLLDVAPDASDDEVRAAWRTQVAGLEPDDRRFDALSRAAKVLLDPASRASYDARLAAEAEEATSLVEEGALAPVTRPRRRPGLVTGLRPSSTNGTLGGRSVPTWLLAGLGVLAVVLVAATTWVWSSARGGDDEAARGAQTAAERAVVPVLSYDHEDLTGSRERARALMTGGYAKEYDKLFAVIADNAPSTRTTVTAEVVSSGIVRAGGDRVQVLVFVDRPTTNKASSEPVVYRDQVTLSMQRVDEEWLVDGLVTSPVSG